MMRSCVSTPSPSSSSSSAVFGRSDDEPRRARRRRLRQHHLPVLLRALGEGDMALGLLGASAHLREDIAEVAARSLRQAIVRYVEESRAARDSAARLGRSGGAATSETVVYGSSRAT